MFIPEDIVGKRLLKLKAIVELKWLVVTMGGGVTSSYRRLECIKKI